MLTASSLYQQRVAERAARYLADWACPRAMIEALQLVGEVAEGAPVGSEVVGEALALAARYQQWRQATIPSPANRPQQPPAAFRKLQKLFIASYEDEAVTFMAIADMMAQLDCYDTASIEIRQAILRDTRVALLPLLERYGLWELNRRAAEALFEHGSQSVMTRHNTILGMVRGSEERCMRVLSEAQRLLAPLLPTGTTVAMHQPRPSRVYLHALAYESAFSKEEVTEMLQREAARLVLDVTVADREACYLALGAIHRLWRPVGNYIRDLIGAPKFNGYQAIHTLVNVTPASDISAEVEFYICSWEMGQFNTWGRIEEYRRQQKSATNNPEMLLPAWWHRAADPRPQALKHQLGEFTAPTYVFSPLGEIFQLDRYATPVDYAFAVHSSFGHAYGGATVNGLPVDPDFPLANGDIVSLQTRQREPTGNRLDRLSQVRTVVATKHIRREFSRQLRHSQRGRDMIQRSLGIWCERYDVNFANVRGERYLHHIAKRWSYSDVEAFYTAVASGRVDPEAIANYIVSREIIHRVGFADGRPLAIRPGRLHIAHCCRPTVRDEIVGRFTQPGTEHARVKIHRFNCQNAQGDQVTPLVWRKVETRGLYEYFAAGYDREGILNDVLRPFHDHQAYLYKVEAERLYDESAQFLLHCELDDAEAAQVIKRAVEAVPEILECRVHTLTRRPTEAHAPRRKLRNAFRYYVPARGRFEFVGRQAEVRELKRLFVDLGGPNQIVIFGPWKVGKTSLLEYIARHDRAEFGVMAVLVDCHKIPNLSLETLVAAMARAIAVRVAQDVDTLGSYQVAIAEDDYRLLHDDPLEGFRRYWERVRPLLQAGEKRIVILIDEFSDLYDDVRHGKIDGSVFRNLRGLFEQEAGIVFVTVIQAAAILEMQEQYGKGAELLESVRYLRLGALDEESVKELLRRKMRLMDLHCQPEIMQRVLSETGGNPYVANILCHLVVERLREMGETTVAWRHIEEAEAEMLNGHGAIYFKHLTALGGSPIEQAVLRALCADPHAPWQSVGEIARATALSPVAMDQVEVEGALGRILSKGLLTVQNQPDTTWYRIQIPLLARWLRESHFGLQPREE